MVAVYVYNTTDMYSIGYFILFCWFLARFRRMKKKTFVCHRCVWSPTRSDIWQINQQPIYWDSTYNGVTMRIIIIMNLAQCSESRLEYLCLGLVAFCGIIHIYVFICRSFRVFSWPGGFSAFCCWFFLFHKPTSFRALPALPHARGCWVLLYQRWNGIYFWPVVYFAGFRIEMFSIPYSPGRM